MVVHIVVAVVACYNSYADAVMSILALGNALCAAKNLLDAHIMLCVHVCRLFGRSTSASAVRFRFHFI